MRPLTGLCRALILLAILAAPALAPGAEPPVPLARYFPKQDLAVLAEFDGLDAHDAAWRKTAASRLLNETDTGAMLENLFMQVFRRVLSLSSPVSIKPEEIRSLFEHVAHHGFAFGAVIDPQTGKPPISAFVVRGAAANNVRPVLERLLTEGVSGGAKLQTVAKPKGRKITIEAKDAPEKLAFWMEGNDLVISLGDPSGVDLVIDAVDGGRPDATTSPQRMALARAEEGFTPVGWVFLQADALAELRPQLAAFGLDGVKSFDYRWGFRGDALVTKTRAIAPAPRSGLLELFDQPTFDRAALRSMPPGLTDFTAFTLDPVRLYDRLTTGIAASDPSMTIAFEAFQKTVRDLTGQRLRDDLLPHFGPNLTLYSVPARSDVPSNFLVGLARGAFSAPDMVVVADVKDTKAFAKVLDAMMEQVSQVYLAKAKEASRVRRTIRIRKAQRSRLWLHGIRFRRRRSCRFPPVSSRH